MQIKTSAKEKFLHVLRKVYQKHKDISHKYISKDKSNFRDPAYILNTPYWAENNISTPQKAIALFEVLDRLKYSDNEIVQYLKFVIYRGVV